MKHLAGLLLFVSLLTASFLIPPELQAQSCSGSVHCIERGSEKRCSGGTRDGLSCVFLADCPFGSCVETPIIVDEYYQSCAYSSAFDDCLAGCYPGWERLGDCAAPTSSCNPNTSWGAWSTCSESCGGGIQTSRNWCTGQISTRACNTHSCTNCYGDTCGSGEYCCAYSQSCQANGTQCEPAPNCGDQTCGAGTYCCEAGGSPQCLPDGSPCGDPPGCAGGAPCGQGQYCCWDAMECRLDGVPCDPVCKEPKIPLHSCGDWVSSADDRMDCCRCGCAGLSNWAARLRLATCGETYSVGETPTITVQLGTDGGGDGQWSRVNSVTVNWGDGTEDVYMPYMFWEAHWTYEYFMEKNFTKSTPYMTAGPKTITISTEIGSTRCNAVKHYPSITQTVVNVIGVPNNPTNTASSCTSYDQIQLSWDAVQGATSYALRVDDMNGQLGDISLVGATDYTCDGYSHDVCANVSGTTATIQVSDPEAFAGATWWVSAVSAGGMSENPPLNQVGSCIPNCSDLQASATVVEQGDPVEFSASFTSDYGQLEAGFDIVTATNVFSHLAVFNQYTAPAFAPLIQRDCGAYATSCTQTYTWDTTNVQVGTHRIFCRAWNNETAECRGQQTDGPPRFDCEGPNSYVDVTVTPRSVVFSGTVYEGSGSYLGGYCTAPDQTAWSGGDGMEVTMSGTAPVPPNAAVNGSNGTYAVTGVPNSLYALQFRLANLPAGYAVQCPAGGVYSYNRTQSVDNINFFITAVRDAWWQATGHIFSRNDLDVTIPSDTCTDAASCDPFLVAKERIASSYTWGNASRTEQSTGIPMSSAQILPTNYLTQRAEQHAIENIADPGFPYDYEYFWKLAGPYEKTPLGSPILNDLITLNSASSLPDGTELYIRDGDLSVSGMPDPIEIPSNRKIVIFVTGNLTFFSGSNATYQVNTVAPGGNLIFIVQQNAEVGAGVGTEDGYARLPNIEGIIITNGNFTVHNSLYDTDLFTLAGSVIARGDITMYRDASDDDPTYSDITLNNTNPTELFIYRPDFVKNFPDIFKTSQTVWSEVQ